MYYISLWDTFGIGEKDLVIHSNYAKPTHYFKTEVCPKKVIVAKLLCEDSHPGHSHTLHIESVH